MSSVFEQVKEIVIEQLGADPDKVVMEANFREDLNADSLDLVEMVMAFEDSFGGEISDEDAQSIRTVADAVSYVEQHLV